MAVAEPTILISTPFAENGDKADIPEVTSVVGRADFNSGFPVETEITLAAGGVPPHRVDFNGLFHMLTTFAHWQQSGGMRTWNNTLDYAPPAIVWYGGEFYKAVQESGPGTSAGAQTPAAVSAYWETLFSDPAGGRVFFSGNNAINNSIGANGDLLVRYLATLAGNGSVYRGLYEKVSGKWTERINLTETAVNNVGMIADFAGTTPPAGWLECNGATVSRTAYSKLFAYIGTTWGAGNGSTTFNLPNFQDYFRRGRTGSVAVGTVEQDAMQPITGTFDATKQGSSSSATGAFSSTAIGAGDSGYEANEYHRFTFDSSRKTRTASETRPKNKRVLTCIRYI